MMLEIDGVPPIIFSIHYTSFDCSFFVKLFNGELLHIYIGKLRCMSHFTYARSKGWHDEAMSVAYDEITLRWKDFKKN